LVRVGDEGGRGLDDLGLPDLTPERLRLVTGGELTILDAGHRVHGVDERDVPSVRREPADLTGQPVVGVDQVVPVLRRAGSDAHHPGGEGAELPGQLLLDQAFIRTSLDVVDDQAGRDLDDRRRRSGRAPREDVDGDTALGQPSRGLSPPASPVPGCDRGLVWTLTMATRRSARGSGAVW
jgi:hypothetical protein